MAAGRETSASSDTLPLLRGATFSRSPPPYPLRRSIMPRGRNSPPVDTDGSSDTMIMFGFFKFSNFVTAGTQPGSSLEKLEKGSSSGISLVEDSRFLCPSAASSSLLVPPPRSAEFDTCPFFRLTNDQRHANAN